MYTSCDAYHWTGFERFARQHAERDIVMTFLSVCLSVCLSVSLSVCPMPVLCQNK